METPVTALYLSVSLFQLTAQYPASPNKRYISIKHIVH